jgi:tetratricopeptide (TPR) repeat protein
MFPRRDPGLFYTFHSDFDYRAYLEQKSHLDSIEIALDPELRNMVSSDEALVKSHIERIHRGGGAPRDPFERFSISVGSVEESIDELKAICELGFAIINIQLNRINQSLEQLIEIARTPDQTWAFEQYSIARDAFRRNLSEEALDYVNRAISGYGVKPGYRLEHRFYTLRGLIRLGNYSNFSIPIFDLQASTDDFLTAAKYAEHQDRADFARNYGLAGWASYCDGRMDDAQSYLRRSIEIWPSDFQSKFDLAKVFFHVGKEREGLDSFSEVIRYDYNYALRAAADADFLRFRFEIKTCIEGFRNDLRGELGRILAEFENLDVQKKQRILSGHGLSLSGEPLLFFENARLVLTRAPLADLKGMNDVAVGNLQVLQDSLRFAKYQLSQKANNLREQRESGFRTDGSEGDKYFLIAGGLPYLFILYAGFSQGFFDGIVAVILGLPFFLIFGVIGKFIFGPIIRSSQNSTKRRRRVGAVREIERDLAKL